MRIFHRIHSSLISTDKSGKKVLMIYKLLFYGLVLSLSILVSPIIASAFGYTITDLDTLPGSIVSYCLSINNSGQAVGYDATYASGDYQAVIFSNGTVTDFNSLVNASFGWTLTEADSINVEGQIDGIHSISGQDHAFLLTPDVEAPARIPKPSTLILLGSGLMVLGGLRRRIKL